MATQYSIVNREREKERFEKIETNKKSQKTRRGEKKNKEQKKLKKCSQLYKYVVLHFNQFPNLPIYISSFPPKFISFETLFLVSFTITALAFRF